MKITVGDLREQLKAFSDDDHIVFGASEKIEFVRVKKRGPKLLQIELHPTIMEHQGKWTVED